MRRKPIMRLLAAAAMSGALCIGSLGSALTARAETQSVTVTAQVDGSYTVTIPKEIVLTLQEDGSHAGEYTVDVEGTIADSTYVSVVPQPTITLSSEGREDVPCDVSQGVQKFHSRGYAGELAADAAKIADGPEASGTVRTQDGQHLASGHWQGTLLFDINLIGAPVAGGAGQGAE